MLTRFRYHAWYAWWLVVAAYNIPLLALHTSSELLLTTVNLLVCVLIRNEPFLHLLYFAVEGTRDIRHPRLKRFFHRLLHMNGDLHIASACWSACWLCVYLARRAAEADGGTVAFIAVILGMMAAMIAFAQRYFRDAYHNFFEVVHRYVGWTLLAVFLGSLLYSHRDDWVGMLTDPVFLLYVCIVNIVFSPWFFVRSVDLQGRVRTTDGVTILTLPGAPKAGSFIRLSHDLVEWHAFGTACRDKGGGEFNVIIAPAGDWTRDLLERCSDEQRRPRRIWVRTIFSVGFMRSVMSYRKVLCVGTGGGIAPILSFLANTDCDHVHMLWVARKFDSYYGSDVVGMLRDRTNTTLYDTAARSVTNTSGFIDIEHPEGRSDDDKGDVEKGEAGRKRVDVTALIQNYCGRHEDVEAVFIVSNRTLTFRVVHELSQLGIISYGAVWDS